MEHSLQRFFSDNSVPRETVDKLAIYHDTLVKWQPKINLVSNSTLNNARERHFLDSAQLFPLLSDVEAPIFDLGSGAGFPGLVLSLLGAPQVSLLESDQRKCIFLSEVIRLTGASAKVINARIESVDAKAKIITSRACASLSQLLNFSAPLLLPDGECLFLKGRGVDGEMEEAQRHWSFHVEQFPSVVDADSHILRLTKIEKKAK